MKQILIVLFLSVFCFTESYKILVFLPLPMHSHFTLASRIVQELLNKGHQITFVTPYPKNQEIQNLKEISVESLAKHLKETKPQLWNFDKKSYFFNILFLTEIGYRITEKILENTNVQNLLHSEEKFDLVILPEVFNEALLPIADVFKAPTILVASMPLFAWTSFRLSLPSPSSYVPNLLSSYTGYMTFWQRLSNSIYDLYSILYHQFIILPKHNKLVKKYIPGKHDFYKILNNASLLLINYHVSLYDALPQPPNVVEIGGFHLQENKKLPNDLEEFLNNSEYGVILFSLGSNLKSTELHNATRTILLNVFSKLKYDILWKWEDDNLPNKPKNVKILKWLPQFDILAHPNVKAFITHGGLFSSIESIYNGVPTVGIPVFSDQKMNMATATSSGYALTIPLQDLTEERLSSALDEVLHNPKYKNNVIKRSKIMKDRLVKPIDLAIYSIEYVVRHQGAVHLRYPGIYLNWFQRNLLDVAAFIIFIILANLYAFNKFYKFIRRINATTKIKIH